MHEFSKKPVFADRYFEKRGERVRLSPMSLEKRKSRKVVPQRGMCSIRPAENSEHGLLTGNGPVWATVFGHPFHERIEFHHELLYLLRWQEPLQPPQIAHVLPRVRELMLQGEYDKGLHLAIDTAKELWGPVGVRNTRRHPALALQLDLPKAGDVTDYLRTLDFQSGEVKVLWTDARGQWERRTFASRPDKVIVQHLEAPKGQSLDVEVTVDTSWRELDEHIDFTRRFDVQSLVLTGTYKVEDVDDGYVVATRIVTEGGQAQMEGDTLSIVGADSLLLFTRIERYETFDRQKVGVLVQELDQVDIDYERLLSRHRTVHQPIIDLMSLDLGGKDEDKSKSSEELQVEQCLCQGFYPEFLEDLFDIGRYWFLVRSGELPPFWGQANINYNLQHCAGNVGNLLEPMRSFSKWVDGLRPHAEINARNIYGCRGTLFDVHPDAMDGLFYHFKYLYPHLYWISSGGWLYNPVYEHYLVTGDREFLEKWVLPALKELALFYEDFLTLVDDNGNFIFTPSYSPENRSPDSGTSAVAINAAMDIMVCKEVLLTLIQICQELDIEDDKLPVWKGMLCKMPPYLLDEYGGLKEYAWPTLGDNFDHRHVSHMYGAWPAHEIQPETAPELWRAAWLANRRKAQGNASAHGIMHRGLAAARLKDSYLVLFTLKQILEQGYITSSLNTYHNPYRWPSPDVQGSIPALVIEMLVYSRPGHIELLPALPDVVRQGSIKGVLCRTQAEIEDLTWDLQAGTVAVTLRSRKAQQIALTLRRGIQSLDAPDGIVTRRPDKGDIHCYVELAAHEPVTIRLQIEG